MVCLKWSLDSRTGVISESGRNVTAEGLNHPADLSHDDPAAG